MKSRVRLAYRLAVLSLQLTGAGCGVYEGDVGLRVCDPNLGTILWSTKTNGFFMGMAADDVHVATAHWGGGNRSTFVTIRDLSSGTIVRSMELARDWGTDARRMTLSPDLQWLYEGGMFGGRYDRGRQSRLWSLQSGTLVRTFTRPRSENDLIFAAFTPDGTKVVTQDIGTGTVAWWDYLNGVALRTLRLPTGFTPMDGSLSRDGSKLVVASNYKTPMLAQVIDTNTGAPIVTLTGHERGLGGVAFFPDGERLATGSFDGTVKLWSLRTGSLLQTIQVEAPHAFKGLRESYNGSIAVSSDSHWLATGSAAHGPVRLWELPSGRLTATLTRRGRWAVAFSPDGRRLVIGGDGRLPRELGY